MNNNRKIWLAAKGVLMVIFVAFTIIVPPKGNLHLILRIAMIVVIGITFFRDLKNYRNGQ